MSYTHVADGSGGYIGEYELPVDGADARNAATVAAPMEGLANDIKAVRTENQGGGTVERLRHISPIVPWDGSAVEWTFPNGGEQAITEVGVSTSVRHQLIVPFDEPHGATITRLAVWCTPKSGHAGLPSLMPRLLLQRRDLATGTTTTLATLTDSTAVLGSYTGTRHTINQGLSVTLDRSSYSYFIILESEGGTNAQDTFAWDLDYKVTMTSPTLRDQGAA